MIRLIVPTADGTNTLYVPHLNEHYHSTYGANEESKHIYISQAYVHSPNPSPTVLEIGFGTGLNAMNTCIEALTQQRKTTYICFEKYPLQIEEIQQLQYHTVWQPHHQDYFWHIHSCPWNTAIAIHPYFTITKIQADICTLHSFPLCDIVYFDAFAPEKQADLWTEEIFARIYASISHTGILTTYCVKGNIRRLLQSIGFTVEKIPGPPQGKREILRAIKQ